MTTAYTPEEIDWLDDARRKQGELDAARGERDRLAGELAVARGEAPAGTEQSTEGGGSGEEQEPAAPVAPSHEEIVAAVDQIPDNLGPEEFMRQLRAIEAKSAPAPPTPPGQLTGQELALALVKAEQEAGGDKDLYYAALDKIPGAYDHSAWGSGRRVH